MGKRKLFMNLLSNVVAFIVLFNVFAFVYVIFYDRMPWMYLLLGIPFFFKFFLREKVKKMWIFMTFHALLLGLPVLAYYVSGSVPTTAITIGFVIFSTFYSLSSKAKPTHNGYSDEWAMQGATAFWVTGVFTVISLILFLALDRQTEGLSTLLNVSTLTCLALIVLYVHMDNMRFSMEMLESKHKESLQATLPNNNIVITVFLCIVVVFGVLSVFFPAGVAVSFILRLIVDIVMLPLRLIGRFLEWLMGEASYLLDMPEMVETELFVLDEIEEIVEHGNSPFIDFLYNVLSAIILLAALVLAGFIVWQFYKRLSEAFKRKRHAEETDSDEDDVTKLKFSFGDLKDFLPRFKFLPKHPIRRTYFKKVSGHMKQGVEVFSHHTPEIIADTIRPIEDIDELTKKYEEVRYGRP